MSLAPGTRFGAYEVLSMLGAGGMGQVYRARDTTLGREVALKALPDAVAHDPDRVARFRREAQILATLNHPLVASIYGVEESGSAPVLILELVEGVTLAERIAARRLTLEDVWRIARQISEALEAAHQQGIVHRDLKPANIKLRPDGAVKVLDFGLARALDPVPSDPEPNAAATVSSPALTRVGVILGTAAYMSPEQARGQPVDRGADIWAFGAVLFEMLTGCRAFEGDDPTQTVASVLKSEPDWSRLPAETPAAIRRLLRRCLEKDRRSRLADMRDARLEIEDAQRGESTAPEINGGRVRTRERLLWIAGCAALAIATGASLATRRPAAVAPPPERRVEITTPPTLDPLSFALSPDGEKLAFVATSDGRTQLWIRSLESGAAQPLRGTDGATFPFWSPDSRSVGFFSAEKLRRVEIDGGAARVLGTAVIGPGASWGRDGLILFSMVPDGPVLRTSDSGGPSSVAAGSQSGPGNRYPQLLPDGRHYLYFVAEERTVFLGAIDAPGRRKLLEADASAVVAPPDQILFIRDDVLYAQRFDAQLQMEGEPVRLATGVAVHPFGGAGVSASAMGSIAYRSVSGYQERQLIWFDRAGRQVGVVGKPDAAGLANPSLSPDGRRVVVNRSIDGNSDLWIIDVDRGVPRRFTATPTPDVGGSWFADGRSILFSGIAAKGFGLYAKPVDTDGAALPLRGLTFQQSIAMDASRDGHVLYRTNPRDNWDIWSVSLRGESSPTPVVESPFDERSGQFSPDGRWIAYESNESGQYEIYVRPFNTPGASRLVSTAGGSQPRWRSDGSELFYLTPDSRLVAVPVKLPAAGTDFSLGSPTPLFQVRATSTVQGGVTFEYAVAADGQRFLVNTFVEHPASPISLILNRRPLPR
jgi:serine/threonine protein kinase/Tol biopolymer transport system component